MPSYITIQLASLGHFHFLQEPCEYILSWGWL